MREISLTPKEQTPNLILELLNCPRKRGLCDIAPFRGAGEIASFTNGEEIADVMDVHGSLLPCTNIPVLPARERAGQYHECMVSIAEWHFITGSASRIFRMERAPLVMGPTERRMSRRENPVTEQLTPLVVLGHTEEPVHGICRQIGLDVKNDNGARAAFVYNSQPDPESGVPIPHAYRALAKNTQSISWYFCVVRKGVQD